METLEFDADLRYSEDLWAPSGTVVRPLLQFNGVLL